jgi:hypothetical protein
MPYKAGMKKCFFPLPVQDWQFLRELARQRGSSLSAESAAIVRTEIERARRRGMPGRKDEPAGGAT